MKKQWLKYLNAIALCTALLGTSYADESSSHRCNRCRWTSYELFEHVVGFESQPMNVMMEKLTPECPELWNAYSDCIGNLLLANIYLGGDMHQLTKAVYGLRFHHEMTLSCISSTVLLSLLNPHSYLANYAVQISELGIIAVSMEDTIEDYYWDNNLVEPDSSIFFWLLTLRHFGCIQPTNQLVLPLPNPNTLLDITASIFEKPALYCQASYNLFAPKETPTVQWWDEEEREESLEQLAAITECLSTLSSADFSKTLKDELGLLDEESSED